MFGLNKEYLIRTFAALALVVGLAFLGMPEANAHKVEYRHRYVHDFHYYSETRAFPRWLKKDRGFKRWYVHNRYRFPRRMSWHRLYDCYLDDRRRYRRVSRYWDGYQYVYRPWPRRRW